jgi:hypothetical protein
MSPSIAPYITAIVVGISMILLWRHLNHVFKSHELLYPIAKRLHQSLMGMAITKHKDGLALAEIMATRSDISTIVSKIETTAQQHHISIYRMAAIMNVAIPRHVQYGWVVYQGSLALKLEHGIIKFDKVNRSVALTA